jgi:hypothetical protein
MPSASRTASKATGRTDASSFIVFASAERNRFLEFEHLGAEQSVASCLRGEQSKALRRVCERPIQSVHECTQRGEQSKALRRVCERPGEPRPRVFSWWRAVEGYRPNRCLEFARVCERPARGEQSKALRRERLAEPIPRVLSSWSASAAISRVSSLASASKATGRTDSSSFIAFASA